MQIDATATFSNNDAPGIPSRLSVEWDSIQPNFLKTQPLNIDKSQEVKEVKSAIPWNTFLCSGLITNLNTLDRFKVNSELLNVFVSVIGLIKVHLSDDYKRKVSFIHLIISFRLWIKMSSSLKMRPLYGKQ